jgi:hypothetical protein
MNHEIKECSKSSLISGINPHVARILWCKQSKTLVRRAGRRSEIWRRWRKKVKLSHYRYTGAKGKRKYRSYSFVTSALDGVLSASNPWPRFTSGKGLPLPIGSEAGSASVLVWTLRLEEKSFASAGDQTPAVAIKNEAWVLTTCDAQRYHNISIICSP